MKFRSTSCHRPEGVLQRSGYQWCRLCGCFSIGQGEGEGEGGCKYFNPSEGFPAGSWGGKCGWSLERQSLFASYHFSCSAAGECSGCPGLWLSPLNTLFSLSLSLTPSNSLCTLII